MSHAAPVPPHLDPNTVHTNKTALKVAGIGALSTIVVAVITGFVAYNVGKPDSERSASGPPELSGLEVEWMGEDGRQDGRYVLTGAIENLGPGQMVWSYNQPLEQYDSNGDGVGDAPGGIYPEYGPCTVDDNRFTCDLGWAGRAEEDAGEPFMIWAAVVDGDGAHAAASYKANYTGTNYFTDEDAVPHVDGRDALASTREIRPDRG